MDNAYAVALKHSLTQINKICPDITHSFIFTRDGKVIARDSETNEKTMEKIINSTQKIAEKAEVVGSLKALRVNGKKGKIILTSFHDMYLTLATSKNADQTLLNSVTRVILPTVFKLVEDIIPTPLQLEPSKQLIVNTLNGFFVGDSVQIDTEILAAWSNLSNQERVDQVKIKAFGGKSRECKVKEIDVPNLKGKGIIRIPEKVCKTLEVKKGDLVKVKPASS